MERIAVGELNRGEYGYIDPAAATNATGFGCIQVERDVLAWGKKTAVHSAIIAHYMGHYYLILNVGENAHLGLFQQVNLHDKNGPIIFQFTGFGLPPMLAELIKGPALVKASNQIQARVK